MGEQQDSVPILTYFEKEDYERHFEFIGRCTSRG